MKTTIRILISMIAMASAIVPAFSQMPVNITANDLVTKVYGVLSPESSKAELCEDCATILNLRPSEEDMGLWLDSTDGYQFSYYGLTVPDVSALASIERDSVGNFGFFFLFPYSSTSTKEEMNLRQSQFCGSLLREMYDIGVSLDVITNPDSLFEVAGNYKGNFVEIRLMDEVVSGSLGRYVLFLSVEPNGFTDADNLAATID